jgi:glycine cleavage system T protein (aminomethyltransferase)
VQPAAALKHTPFHTFHKSLGAKLVDFAGFEMPLRYTGDVREHLCVRNAAGLFDISHMGEFEVRGAGAMAFVDRMVANDVKALAVGQALYTPICRPGGGIVDDVLVYRCADYLMLVVNASNIAKDFGWLSENRSSDVELRDVSDETSLLAVQGPKAAEILRSHMPAAALELAYYHFMPGKLFGVDALISRTGYTGEDGFELYFHERDAEGVWDGLMVAGRPHGLEAIGLGARDTLRLEMGYMLYGNDIDDTTSPLEAGLGWTVKLDKGEFIGREAMLREKERGLARKLVGLVGEGRRVPRHGMTLEVDGRVVGQVTSGAHSPSLDRPIAMGYVETAYAKLDTSLDVVTGSTRLPVRVVKRPFYTRGSHK